MQRVAHLELHFHKTVKTEKTAKRPYRRRLLAGLLVEGVLDIGKDNVALGALAGREAEAVRVALEHARVLAADQDLSGRMCGRCRRAIDG